MRSIIRGVAAALALLAGACGDYQPARTGGGAFLQARADTGLEMRIVLPRDTIHALDRAPVDVLISIVNGPRPTHFDNDPERFNFQILGPDGRVIDPDRITNPPTGANGTDGRMVLPAGGVLQKAQNLRCLDYDGYVIMPASARECRGGWDLRTPGRYRVVVEYYGPRWWPDVQTPPDPGRMRDDNGDEAVLDTAVNQPVTHPLADGRRLADTAALVVVP